MQKVTFTECKFKESRLWATMKLWTNNIDPKFVNCQFEVDANKSEEKWKS